jgi:bacillithiol biosynthesis deacetylase BshB1
MHNPYKVDVLVLAAHPDDAELGAGGTIAKLTKEGKSVAIVDLTQGEMGTRGTIEIRKEEAARSAEILGIKYRENLMLPDGYVENDTESQLIVIYAIRKYRPELVIMNPEHERHPDHEAAHSLVRTSMFKAGLQKIETHDNGFKQERHRIRKMFCFMQSYPFQHNPDFIVDISETIEEKMESIKAYKSQVFIPGESKEEGLSTRLFRPGFLEDQLARAKYFGSMIGAEYGEAFTSVEPIGLDSIGLLI